MDCLYCNIDERLHGMMIPLKEMKWSNIYLFRDQKHEGRLIVALKGHKDEIWQMDPEQRAGFFDEVAVAAEAAFNVTGAGKINYATYGDNVSHFHVHIVPKMRGGLQWGSAFADNVEKKLLTDEEYKVLGDKILAEIEKIMSR